MKKFDIKLLFKLLKYVIPFKIIFGVTVFSSICFGLFSTVRPLLIQYAFDNYIINGDSRELLKIILVISLFLLFEALFQFIFIYQSNYLAQKIIKNIRLEVFARVMKFKISYFDNTPTGQLITRIISDTESISSIFSQGIIVFLGDIFKMLLIIICMFMVSWKLACVSLAFLPFLAFSTFVFQKYMRQAFVDVRKYIGKINIYVHEHILGMNIVQIFGNEKQQMNLFKDLNATHRDAHLKTILYFSIFLPIVDVFSAIAMGLLVWFGVINAISNSSITVGQIIAFILFINMLFRPLRSMADRFNVLQMGIVAASRVFEVLEDSLNYEKNDNSISFDTLSSGPIHFKNVFFSYKPNELVLHNINFNISPNQTLAIVGPTGSGKTTIINLILKWYQLIDGEIYINDTSINDISNLTLRKNIGVVLQDTFFLADSLMNNIKFFHQISDQEVFDAVKRIGLQDFINKFPEKYNYFVGERGDGLSEGEKQLISFLRIYLLNPSYLILDEATSSMDPLTERLIQQSIKSIVRNRTSIIIAHRLSTIKDADKIIVLEKGRIIEIGTHNELIRLNKKYANYYYQQFINN